MSQDLEGQIRAMVAEQLGVDPGEVESRADLLDDLGADSLDVVELVMSLEETFEIEIPDDDVSGLRTVSDVGRYVASAAS